jgi:subtilisin family serine protease
MLLAIVAAHVASPTWAAEETIYRIASPAGLQPARKLRAEKAALHSKAGHALARSFAGYREHIGHGKRGAFRPRDRLVQVSSGHVLIDARATNDGARLLEELKGLGLQHGKRRGNIVSGLLPLSVVDRAAALDSLRSIAASPPPIRNTGSITTQGDIALRADVTRSVHGVDGTGVTVGVLSDSYNTLAGAAADIASGDLPPAGVTVLNGESTLCGSLIFCVDEGRAMLQLVYDLAPGAELLFHSALDGKAAYATAIAALAAAGADVIVDDLFYLNEPMFQDGIIAQAVDVAVAGGAAYYSAAGNQGRNGYEAAFSDSGEVFCIELLPPAGDCHAIYERVGVMHDFDPGPGIDTVQSVTVPVNGVLTIAMQWDAPFGGVGPNNDHDIMVLDDSGAVIFEISANDNVVMGEGWEVLQFQNADVLDLGTSFGVAITYDDVDSTGPPATLLKTVIFGSGNTLNEHTTSSGTVIGHANAVGAAAVGAAFFLDTPEFGMSPAQLEPYSSAGGSPVLFDVGGVPLATPEVRQKPEFTAVDGVNTTFFFNDSHGADGIDDFFGTSAAAPHAAAVAALLLEAAPLSTPAELNTVLKMTALNMGAAGFDYDSGHGLIQADLAIDALTLDTDGDGVLDFADNCVSEPNGPLIPAACDAGIVQRNTDGDALGDACDMDDDEDGLPDTAEDIDANCTVDSGETDALNSDTDGDDVGDGQDQYPLDPLLSGLIGDISGDGQFDVRDLLLMEQALIGRVTLDLAETYRADLHPDGDDDIDLADLLALQSLLLPP